MPSHLVLLSLGFASFHLDWNEVYKAGPPHYVISVCLALRLHILGDADRSCAIKRSMDSRSFVIEPRIPADGLDEDMYFVIYVSRMPSSPEVLSSDFALLSHSTLPTWSQVSGSSVIGKAESSSGNFRNY